MRRARRTFWVVAALFAVSAVGQAQPLLVPVALAVNNQAAGVPTSASPSTLTSNAERFGSSVVLSSSAHLTKDSSRSTASPWWTPVASALVPGTGQFAMGQQRSVAYLVGEAYLVVQAISAQRNGDRDRDEYRSLASDVARSPFSVSRPIGPWRYYESMEKFVESGVFDRIPGGAVDPETDVSTYNGARWRLARDINWSDPNVSPPTTSAEYQRALAFYSASAIRDEFRWSWRNAQLQKDVYEQTIKSANRRYQRATNALGLVYTNHLASMIDAYVTVRVRRYGGVRVAGLQLDGLRSSVHAIGDPADGHRQIVSALRFVLSPD